MPNRHQRRLRARKQRSLRRPRNPAFGPRTVALAMILAALAVAVALNRTL
jgi:hypothetical protein